MELAIQLLKDHILLHLIWLCSSLDTGNSNVFLTARCSFAAPLGSRVVGLTGHLRAVALRPYGTRAR
jgi:hypothetical protein